MTPDKKPNPKAETTSMVLNGIMIGLGEIPCLGIFEGSYNESAESFLDDAGDSAMFLCHHMLVRPKVLDGGGVEVHVIRAQPPIRWLLPTRVILVLDHNGDGHRCSEKPCRTWLPVTG